MQRFDDLAVQRLKVGDISSPERDLAGLALDEAKVQQASLVGVAMLNGIVLVSFLNEQREKGLSVREAAVCGTALGMRPVMMTASVTILGLVPMLLSSGVGAETQHPLATVVIGGLITSTLLTLVLLPVLYDWIEERAARRRANT